MAGILMTPDYDKRRAQQIAQASAPQPAAEAPELTDKQRTSSIWKGILQGLAGSLEKGGPAGGILSGMDRTRAEQERSQYQGYLDERLERGDMTDEQRDAMMARRYSGEKYGATSRPWWSSSQKPQIIEVPLPGGMVQNWEIGPDGVRTKSGAPYAMWNPDYGSRGRDRSATPTQEAGDREIRDARKFVRSRGAAQVKKDIAAIMGDDDPTSWLAKKYHLASQAMTGGSDEDYDAFMNETWGARKPFQEPAAEEPEEKSGSTWWDPRTWNDDKPDSVESLEEAMARE